MMVPRIRIFHGNYDNHNELEDEVNQWMRGLTNPDDIIRTHIVNIGDELVVSIFYRENTMSSQQNKG